MLTFFVLLSSCGRSHFKPHRTAVKSAVSLLPQAVEIEALFGETDHFISHFSPRFGPGVRQWNSEVYFGGRYSLTMQADVKVDFTRNMVTEVVGSPKFYLAEYIKIGRNENGNIESHGGEGAEFEAEEWKVFFESGGDFATLGLKKTLKPLQHFNLYVDAMRAPRERISLQKKGDAAH